MRLVMLTNDWAPIEGGIATLCEGTATALAARGHAVTVLAPQIAGEHVALTPGVSVRRWRGYDLGPARLLPFAVQARPLLGQFDAALAMNPAYGGALAAVAGLPFVCWTYGFELLKAVDRPQAALYRFVFARARATVAISRFTADIVRSLGGTGDRPLAIVPPGVAPAAGATDASAVRARLQLPERGPMVLTVGRLVARKGHAALARAMARVVARHRDVTWVVVGRGPGREHLERLTRDLGIADRVHLTGYLAAADLDALYRTASVFALTPEQSRGDAEGFGIVFLEAGARGCPVVAGDSGGVGEAVVDGHTGHVVAPGDDGAIAAALLAVLDQPEHARRLGEAGRERAREHSWDRVAGRVEALLEAAP